VYMITGLDITGSVQPWDFKGSSRKQGWNQGADTKTISWTIWRTAPLVKLNTGRF
jgi:hypothetical protein